MKNQLERLTEAYLAEVLNLEEYKRRRAELEQQQTNLVKQVQQLEANARHQQDLSMLVDSVQAFCKRVEGVLEEATFEQKRQLVELLIDRVVVRRWRSVM